jgi:ketosteroid isomerase-like protein
MKKYILFLSFLLGISFFAIAQNKNVVVVEKAVEQLRLAMISGDSTQLRNLVSDRLSYGHSGGHVDDAAQFVEKIASGKSDFVTIELKNQTIDVKNGVAIVRHTLNATTNDGGKPSEVHLLVLMVWQKEKGVWKMIARQAVKQS